MGIGRSVPSPYEVNVFERTLGKARQAIKYLFDKDVRHTAAIGAVVVVTTLLTSLIVRDCYGDYGHFRFMNHCIEDHGPRTCYEAWADGNGK